MIYQHSKIIRSFNSSGKNCINILLSSQNVHARVLNIITHNIQLIIVKFYSGYCSFLIFLVNWHTRKKKFKIEY